MTSKNKIDKAILQSAIKSLEAPGKSFSKLPKEESKTKPVLYVFRHGETYDNKRKIFSGWRQSRLTKKGITQAKILSEKLKHKKIDVAFESHLVRSMTTLKIVLKYHPQAKVEIDDRIIERNYGDLAGKSKTKMMKENPVLAAEYRRAYNFPPPHGESLKIVEKRVFPFCKDLIRRMKKEKINAAVSCHGNSMRVIRRFFEKLTIKEELTMENPLGQDYVSYVIK